MNLAQINIGRLRYPRGDERLSGWADNVGLINAMAEMQPGFVWRLSGAEGQETGRRAFGDPQIVTNMSVWRDYEAFRAFVFRTEHADFLRARRDWFEPMDGHHAMWWIEEGWTPTLDEGAARIRALRADGPTERAFTIHDFHPEPSSKGSSWEAHG